MSNSPNNIEQIMSGRLVNVKMVPLLPLPPIRPSLPIFMKKGEAFLGYKNSVLDETAYKT